MNIRKAKNPIMVHCNNILSYTNLEGNLGSMTMYHNPYDIASVLSLEWIKGKHRVTYNSWDCDSVFKVHTKKGVVEFKPSEKRAPLTRHIRRGQQPQLHVGEHC